MANPSDTAFLYCLLTLVFAMILRIMQPFPGIELFNPDWIMLVLIYWSIALPERFGVFTAWSIGLLTDVLTGRLLGQFALIFALICYFSIRQHRRLRQFPIIQQCLFIFCCLLGEQVLIFLTQSMQGTNRLDLTFWYPIVSGTLVWPLVFLLLRYIRVAMRIG